MREILEFFVTCPKGVEGLLRDEVLALGADAAKETVAGVSVQGDIELGYRLCLWSRLGNRVLLVLKRFLAGTAEDLYAGVQLIDWRDHLAVDGGHGRVGNLLEAKHHLFQGELFQEPPHLHALEHRVVQVGLVRFHQERIALRIRPES